MSWIWISADQVAPYLQTAETFEACELPFAQSPIQIPDVHTSAKQSMHYWLRPIKSGQFRFANLAPNFKGKCHFHFLIH